ncbi:hypothetical protein [Micromonospora sp. NPDC048830]|uniref:hypothetical protein n=1 Tax=Micromonospora sp. NPDC048830 TaxID=3364257 RepID=UPI003721DA2B
MAWSGGHGQAKARDPSGRTGSDRSQCTIWGGFMADPAGTIHYHDRANPAIGGIGTCF